MTAWVTVWLMMLAAGHQSADANQREGPITCEIPSVKVGATAILTCRFPVNVTRDAISIENNDPTGRLSMTIPMLSCNWRKGSPNCVIEDKRMTFNSTTMISVHDNVVVVFVEVAEAGPDDEREYVCDTPIYPYTSCSFKLDIDECISSPCENGGSCQDQVIAYTCNCTAGFTGDRCQTATVTTSEPCAPHAGWKVAVWIMTAGLVILLLVVIVLTETEAVIGQNSPTHYNSQRRCKKRGANGSKEGSLQKRKSDLLTKRVTNEEGIQLLTLNITELRDQLSATDSEKEALVKDNSHIQTQLEIAQADANSLKQDLEAEKTHLAAEQRKIDKTKEELEAIRSERLNMFQEQKRLAPIPELQKKLDKEKKELEILQKWNTLMQAENNKIKDRRKEASELRATLQKNQSELHEAAEYVRLLTDTLKKNKEELKEHDKSKSDLQKQLKVSDRDLTALSTKVQALEKEGMFQKLQHEIEMLRQRLGAE